LVQAWASRWALRLAPTVTKLNCGNLSHDYLTSYSDSPFENSITDFVCRHVGGYLVDY
jgi:hypothetical protein